MSQHTDTVQRFLLSDVAVKGEIAHLQESYQTILAQRAYPPVIQHLLGEALAACVLLADRLKFEGSYSLQFQGDARFSLLLVQCDNHRQLRGLATFEPDLDETAYRAAFLKGQMMLTLHAPQHQKQDYQSKLPIQSLSIANNLSQYFEQSEQTESFIWLAADGHQAAGFLIQQLPTSDASEETRAENWSYALHLAKTITEAELFSLDNATLLHRLYHETAVKIFETQIAKFQCRCTPERIHHALKVLGHQECLSLLNTYKTVETRCEFCNQAYTFNATEIADIFKYENAPDIKSG